ncbi:hypothetical protein B7463_g4768, partial [Scytalidium lignicola]
MESSRSSIGSESDITMQPEEEKHSFLHDKQLEHEEEAQHHQKYLSDKKWRLSLKSLVISWLTLISLTCFGVVLYLLLTAKQSTVSVTPTGKPWLSEDTLYSCGSSVPEAKSLGCIFDTMSFIWVHPACYDHELTVEFEMARDWKWYTEYHGEKGNGELISMDDVRTGNFDAWVPWEFHTVHSIYFPSWNFSFQLDLDVPVYSLNGYVRAAFYSRITGPITLLQPAAQLTAQPTS